MHSCRNPEFLLPEIALVGEGGSRVDAAAEVCGREAAIKKMSKTSEHEHAKQTALVSKIDLSVP